MAVLPENLLVSLTGIQGFDKKAFEKVHACGEQVTSIRINPSKMDNGEWSMKDLFHHSPFTIHEKIPWTAYGYYLSQRPSFTFDPRFHAGCYYVQEASSMFLEVALKQTVDLSQPLKVLDLCAAPGGKSTHIQSLISSQSILVSNEVIKSRANILKQNIIKWGSENVIVTNNDPQHFSKLPGFFDVIVVDAPCSGSGLFRKDADAISEWSADAVALCCGRQKRILSDILPALKNDGILIYSTCSYSKEEDEDIADWLVQEQDMEGIKLSVDAFWGIVETASPISEASCYRFYPDQVKGEGFFIACFKKKSQATAIKYKPVKPDLATAKEKTLAGEWMNINDRILLKHHDAIFTLPLSAVDDFYILRATQNIQYAGTFIGQVIRDKIIPDHALAVSNLISNKIKKVALNHDDAIRYLQKGEINPQVSSTGWQLVSYQNKNLGWINVLPNRINNYYPKELRILKHRDQ